MAKLNMVQAINMALHQEMAKDRDVLVLGEDVAVDGGVFRLTEGLLEKFGRERVIDTRHDDEDGVRAHRARFHDLPGVEHEILA